MADTPTATPTAAETASAQSLVEQAQRLLAEAAKLDPSTVPGAGAGQQGEAAPAPPPPPRSPAAISVELFETMAGMFGNHPKLDALLAELKSVL